MPGFPVRHQLPELAQTHVHRVSDAIQASHPLSFPSPGDLPDPGIKLRSTLQVDSLPSKPPGKPILLTYLMLISICFYNQNISSELLYLD